MTRQEMITELEVLYQRSTEEQRTRPLVQEPTRTWNFTQIMEQVHLQTPSGMLFIDNMIISRQTRHNNLN
jgi:hypothetical protein